MSESRIELEGLKPSDIALLKDVAESAAEKTVSKMMIALGIDPTKQLEAQADMQFLRSTRERCEGVAGKAILTIVGLLVLSVLGALWIGFKTMVADVTTFRPPHP